MSERNFPDEVLVDCGIDDHCMNCGELTRWRWIGYIPFCSIDCMEEYLTQWGKDVGALAREAQP